ncbi:MAG: hypothetical protein HGA44_03130 [Cellulomonadaceae bacterium]|nr:hypothetical protein [Cellulomonadaceae bacterium]
MCTTPRGRASCATRATRPPSTCRAVRNSPRRRAARSARCATTRSTARRPRSGPAPGARPQGTSEIAITNVTNVMTQRRDDPFGYERGTAPTSWPSDRGFLNKPKDTTGLVQMGARYYDPLIGRFLSVDPAMDLSDPQQWAAYSYANNNPITFSDPTGLWPKWMKSAAKATTGFVKKYQGEIVGAVVGTVVTSACLAGSWGIGSVGCLAAGGAAGAAATNLWKSKVQHTQAFSWSSLAKDTAIGGAIGALTGVAGKGIMAIPGVRGLTTRATEAAAGAVSKAASKVATAVSSASKAVARGSTKAANAVKGRIGTAVSEMRLNPKLGSTQSPGGRAAADGAGRTAARACLRSFAGTTLVLMADGSKEPIEDVKVGDKVVATDPQAGERVIRKVTHLWVHRDTLADLVLANGTVLTTTEDHLFWSVTDQRFERADELAGGEVVLGDGGREATVVGFQVGTERDGLAYNLSIAGVHTYHVGTDEIIVHNDCSDEAWDIANNHAFDDHGADLGFGSIEEMGSHIDDLMGASAGRLRDDGTRFWIDYANSAIVFRGPNAAIPGTFYRPDNFLRAAQQNLDRTVIP